MFEPSTLYSFTFTFTLFDIWWQCTDFKYNWFLQSKVNTGHWNKAQKDGKEKKIIACEVALSYHTRKYSLQGRSCRVSLGFSSILTVFKLEQGLTHRVGKWNITIVNKGNGTNTPALKRQENKKYNYYARRWTLNMVVTQVAEVFALIPMVNMHIKKSLFKPHT